MSDSKTGSKSNLNESNMPLLDDEQMEKGGNETSEKEQMIEMTEAEKAKAEKEEKKKAKLEAKKAKKEAKEKSDPGPSCIETLTAHLDMNNRDGNAINAEIDLNFDDVLAEPGAALGFEGIWRLAFVVFSQTKLWVYRILAAVFALPLAFLWAIIFALITVVYVWIFAPFLRIIDLAFTILRKVWNGLAHATLEPLCRAFGAFFSRVSVSQQRHIVHDA